jgi:hypothetical protein
VVRQSLPLDSFATPFVTSRSTIRCEIEETVEAPRNPALQALSERLQSFRLQHPDVGYAMTRAARSPSMR